MSPEDWPLAQALAERLPQGTAYRVFVRDLVLAVSIGIHAHEKRQRTRIRINTELLVGSPLPSRDDFAEAVDYETIVAGIKRLAGERHINLVETLAGRIASFCLGDERVQAARITVEKLDIYPEAESVGVTVERARPAQAPAATAR